MPIDFEYLYNKLHKIAADEELEASKEENEKDDARDSGAKSDKEKANSDDDDIEDQ